MTLEQLKYILENNQPITQKYFIFECSTESSQFVFHQYLNLYCVNNNLNINFIDELTANNNVNLFTTTNTSVDVLYTDKLTSSVIPNRITWVRCKSIDKNLLPDISEYVISIPALENWHLKDYAYSLLPKLSQKDIDQLVKTHDNIYMLDADINKIKVFDNYDVVYKDIKDQIYIDLSEYKIFDLVNCFVRYDKTTLHNLLLQLDNIDIDIFGLLTLLIRSFKHVIDIQLSKVSSPESVGVSSKQYWAIKKYSCNVYTRNQLIQIYSVLTNCDFYIKSGYISASMLLNYLIITIMTIKERTN